METAKYETKSPQFCNKVFMLMSWFGFCWKSVNEQNGRWKPLCQINCDVVTQFISCFRSPEEVVLPKADSVFLDIPPLQKKNMADNNNNNNNNNNIIIISITTAGTCGVIRGPKSFWIKFGWKTATRCHHVLLLVCNLYFLYCLLKPCVTCPYRHLLTKLHFAA